jgi:hypothetical protein
LLAVIEVELVTKPGTATWLNCNAEIEVIATFLCKQ